MTNTSRELTRRDFLKVAGTGVAGATLLGATGCSGPLKNVDLLSENYLPTGGSRMNVVLVVIDSLRKDHIGAYGGDKAKTPNLDAFAGESLKFTQAYPEAAPTIPARRAIHTGYRSFPFRDWSPRPDYDVNLYGWRPIPEDQSTLAETLRDDGYSTMIITDTLHMFRPSYNFHRGFGVFEFIRGQERDLYRPKSLRPEGALEQCLIGGPTAARTEDILKQYLANIAGRQGEDEWFSPRLFGRGAELLEAAREMQPFFMVVDSYDVHEPWDPPKSYVDLYDDAYNGPEPYIPAYGSSDYLTERQLQRMQALYAAEVTMVDSWFGRFMDKADELGMTGNTLFILLSDHGVMLGDHGITGKQASGTYTELINIPFLVRHPEGKGAGETSEYYASTHDVAPTILGSLGVEQQKPMQGQDLSVILDGGQPEERPYFALGYDQYVWARDDQYVMISRNDGSRARLYDMQKDPEQNNDIASANPAVAKRMFEDYVLEAAGGPLPSY
ncbi:MAG: sulfatase-like hydrolase/transferase [Rubrobacteraceae bacterium]